MDISFSKQFCPLNLLNKNFARLHELIGKNALGIVEADAVAIIRSKKKSDK